MPRLGFRSLSAAALFAVAFGSTALAEEPAKSDADIRKLNVEELVERLASPERPSELTEPWGYMHPRVKTASEELVARGQSVIPKLLERRADERYSWSEVWSVRLDLTVGDRAMRIVEEILEPKIQVEARMGVMKGYPRFANYLGDVGAECYLEWSKGATEQERELDLLRWYVRKVDEDYRQRGYLATERGGAWLDEHLVPFRKRVAELEMAGVKTKGPRDEASAAANAEAKSPIDNR